jgi:stage V sporulation protein R
MSNSILNELNDWDEKIVQIAQSEQFKLDWYDIEYETCDYHEMIGSMVYSGMPSHYSHWSYGKSFERTHQMYNVGAEGLPYELIINSNPSIAYLMRDNPLYLQILIMAHCVGHSDFFKNNRMFAKTRPDTVIQRFRSAKKRIQGYVEDPHIGIDQVEAVIDACHAVQFQISRNGKNRKTRQEIICEYSELINNDKTGQYKNIDLQKNPVDPDYDLLQFISENGRLPSWKKDIIDVCIDESHYFMPQIQTKIANEGWASYTHYTICHELGLPDELHIPILKMHNQVVRPHVGAINPYHLGFHLFQKIKERHGYEECLVARESCNDASFIRQYLTEEDCYELNLFSYSKRGSGSLVIDDVSDHEGWENVKQDLLQNIGGASIPVIYVEEARKDGTLVIKHEHNGKDLELNHANKVVEHLKILWEGNVKLFTTINGRDWEI